MRGPAASGGRASAAAPAVLFGVLVLVSLVVVVAERPSAPAIGGRRMLLPGDGGEARRTLEDFRADDPFQDSARRVPNGPDPIHNRGAGKSGRSPGRE
ncbi:hypothetical protein CFC21_077320 [Triticum aestivum]|uniref:Uncharacterized protein n=2 Tax=Triticum aestivum TaxID=4565 RepID=A0A9R1HWH5_WHEAT|nr:CLAVATA3/ESR (CLE)-related protein 25 [Triticum aestivum]KAF7072151.1 hypothetical protein CFC21_077320 [Triticum aestivum]